MTGSRDDSRVVLHVGLPKSGTTFLQSSLAANAKALADRGVLYPQTRDDVMFRAALDVRGNHKAWGRSREDVAGAWDHLCRSARDHTGTTVVSHELLAAATGRQVAAAMTMLKGLDVHVVLTVRDPARQLLSEWQEGVKHGRRLTFDRFVAAVAEESDGVARRFHAAQDLLDVVDRWGVGLPAENIHVVVGPRRSDDAHVLWARFAQAVGFDPDGFPPTDGNSNSALGADEVDLLRRLNVALDGRLPQPRYGRLVKHRIAHKQLATTGSVRPRVPAAVCRQLVPLAEQWAEHVQKAGYVVHGDLDDLLPVVPEEDGPHPDATDAGHQLDLATSVMARLLLDLAAAEEQAAARDEKRKTWKKRAKELRRRLDAGA